MSQSVPERTIEQLAEAILAWEHSTSLDRDPQVDAPVSELIHAIAAQQLGMGELCRECAELLSRAIAAYTAIRGE